MAVKSNTCDSINRRTYCPPHNLCTRVRYILESSTAGNIENIELSVVIPAKNEENTIGGLIADIQSVCRRAEIRCEILVVTENPWDATWKNAGDAMAVALVQQMPGYGGALREGFGRCQGHWILTMDADLSHPPDFIEKLWEIRENYDLLIASRWAPGGGADMPRHRYFLSKVLNYIFALILNIPIKDISSGYRLYRKASLEAVRYEGSNFDILQSILSGLLAADCRVGEIPFHYRPRVSGSSNARIFEFGFDYLKAVFRIIRANRLRKRK